MLDAAIALLLCPDRAAIDAQVSNVIGKEWAAGVSFASEAFVAERKSATRYRPSRKHKRARLERMLAISCCASAAGSLG